MFQMVIAGGVDNVKHVEVYVQAVFWEIQANTTAVALDDSFMGSGMSSDRCYFWLQDRYENWDRYIYQWLCEVCTTKLLQTPIVLGGAGEVVQIDESLFRHKPKVI